MSRKEVLLTPVLDLCPPALLRRLLHNLNHPPTLPRRWRPRLDNAHPIPRRGSQVIVRHKLGSAPYIAPILGMKHQPINSHHHSLLHLVGGNRTHLLPPVTATPGNRWRWRAVCLPLARAHSARDSRRSFDRRPLFRAF